MFQEMVNTYGVPTYGEANPAMFAVVSFPFLFGVMYGDIGHGSILLLAGVLLCTFSDKIKHIEDMELFYRIRYMILLMGFFGTYMGFIYNDFMSLPLELFGKGCYDAD
jgi:V-type H+-transporting ATPase subunit a